jgi:hypothetical protein
VIDGVAEGVAEGRVEHRLGRRAAVLDRLVGPGAVGVEGELAPAVRLALGRRVRRVGRERLELLRVDVVGVVELA